jgi:folylpolyglutamate synthase/dihydropteroate synthase
MWRRQRRVAIRRAPLPAELVYREINEARCAASSAFMRRMRVRRNELFYALDRLRREGRVEALSLGRAALWCINSAAAEAVLAELAEALKGLLRRRSRFVTTKEILRSRRGQRNA